MKGERNMKTAERGMGRSVSWIDTLKKMLLVAVMLVITGISAQAAAGTGISATKATIVKGSTISLTINGKAKASWKSSNKKVAAVNSKGVVKGCKTGTAKISAKVKGKTYTCKVTVKARKTMTGASASYGTVTALNKDTSGMTSAEAKAYRKMLALKSKYPEGKSWTNDDYYAWNGGIYAGGYGCAAFVFLLSDAAFGETECVRHTNLKKLMVGDIIRVDNDSHSVIVMRKTASAIVVAEGNYNASIHWGRVITMKELKASADYILTRYAA